MDSYATSATRATGFHAFGDDDPLANPFADMPSAGRTTPPSAQQIDQDAAAEESDDEDNVTLEPVVDHDHDHAEHTHLTASPHHLPADASAPLSAALFDVSLHAPLPASPARAYIEPLTSTATPPPVLPAPSGPPSRMSSTASFTGTPLRARSGLASPALRQSLSSVAVHDPLVHPLAALVAPSAAPLAPTTAPAQTVPAVQAPAPLLPAADMHPGSPDAASSVVGIPPRSTVSTPTTPFPPPLAAVASPIATNGGADRSLPAVPASPAPPSALQVDKRPLSYSKIQLQVPAVAASPFKVSVSEPTKIGDAMSPFTAYKVVTKTTQPGFRSESVVSRRYSEFLWLYQRLVTQHPGIVVPGTPEKQAIGRFSEGFVEHRRVGLQVFLRKVAAHPVLRTDPAFQMFVEAESLKDEIQADKNVTLPPKAKMNEIDPWFEEKRRQVDQFEAQIKALNKSLDLLATRQRETATAHYELAETLAMLAEVELPHPFGRRVEMLAETHKRVRDLLFAMATIDLGAMQTALDDQLRTVAAIRVATQLRANAYVHWQALETAVLKKEAAVKKSRVQMPALEAEVYELTQQRAAAKNLFETTSMTLRQELERVDQDKVHELSAAIKCVAESLWGHQQETVNLWDELIKARPAMPV
ncbi:hypothetical protein AMAG_06610 [Allomyces macrogynus ATCC 38327]|uniref:PX domain-containing protein n=1 Tax=Allomyces macrogynus (strain ATCC 38327) TaxID=578462 RepID=A0A0L0SEI8_ALLM3|nr:hypothetical protein AMAG_06610 [Allomyces macrogynus ATCC 38327]|eukprot:KNE60844.1 hypothetical protein AMAG_06610 [Allomyces macrogynus ATCC 38327]